MSYHMMDVAPRRAPSAESADHIGYRPPKFGVVERQIIGDYAINDIETAKEGVDGWIRLAALDTEIAEPDLDKLIAGAKDVIDSSVARGVSPIFVIDEVRDFVRGHSSVEL